MADAKMEDVKMANYWSGARMPLRVVFLAARIAGPATFLLSKTFDAYAIDGAFATIASDPLAWLDVDWDGFIDETSVFPAYGAAPLRYLESLLQSWPGVWALALMLATLLPILWVGRVAERRALRSDTERPFP